jgi:enoyl-CoA hydratase
VSGEGGGGGAGGGRPVRTERSGSVLTVVLDRPEARNAVDGPTAADLADAFRAFDADDSLSVAVLWGAGGTFCAGADLKAMTTPRTNRVTDDGDGPMGPTRMRLTKPVIAAVSGYAVAGGLELALWCDLRVAEEDATFGVFCRRWGVPLIDGGTVRLPRLIGHSRAMDMILTGRPVSAPEALQIGLANRVVPPRPGPRRGRGAGRLARRPASGLPAPRPSGRARAVGSGRERGHDQRAGPRPGVAGQPGTGRRRGPLPGRRRPARLRLLVSVPCVSR